VKIVIIVEGTTEKAFRPHLERFLAARLAGNMPRLNMFTANGRISKGDRLRREVENLLGGSDPADAVIALTDVYTGTDDFQDAADAKTIMRDWVGPSMTSRLGYCRIGLKFKKLRVTIGHHRAGRRSL
jgi:hypothetical protein